MSATEMIRSRFKFDKNSPWHFYRKVLLWSFVLSACITIPFIIVEFVKTGSAIFLYYGDYNAQQLPFYEHCVRMVQEGSFGWDWVTDLGSNFIGSYSYYMLGSPFFWVMCPFPATWAPYLMAPMFMLKYIVAAILAYAYIQRFVRNKNYAVIGALLYSFSGFQIYNTFFNQFHDVVAFFPLILIGMEELVQNNRRGLFAIAVAINAMINYFMFAGQVVFCVIYFLFRLSTKSFNITIGKFISLAVEAVLGFMMAMFIFLPGAYALMGNDRIDSSYTGTISKGFEHLKNDDWDKAWQQFRKLFVWRNSGEFYWQRYGQIFESYFFPPDIPSRVNFFNGHATRWASISTYLPLFSLSGVLAFFTVKKRTWLKALIVFLTICSFVPILNSMFFLFNSSYYARWLYLFVLMLALATSIALDDNRTKWKVPNAILIFIMTAVVVPLGLIWHEDGDEMKLGYPPYRFRFWLYTAIAITGVILTAYIIRRFRGTKLFERAVLIGVAGMTVFYGCVHITNGKQHSQTSSFMVDQCIEGTIVLPDPHEEFFRIDQYKGSNISTIDNLGIYWNYPTIQNFHTIVPPSIMDFYDCIGIRRSVGSRTDSSVYGVRAFLSVRFSVIESAKNSKTVSQQVTNPETGKMENVKKKVEAHNTFGFEKYDTQNGYDIYENKYYIPMGFAYSEFMTESDFEKAYSDNQRAPLLCKYLVVPDDMAEYYEQFMTKVTPDKKAASNTGTYEKAVAERKTMCCDDFTYSSDGFEAHINLDKPSIVYFSVPHEEYGWTASVNGKETDVLEVTYGFMAVECPAGESTIRFDYNTPGFVVPCTVTVGDYDIALPGGVWISLTALAIYICYMLFFMLYKKQKADTKFFSFEYFDNCGGDLKNSSADEYTEESFTAVKIADSDVVSEDAPKEATEESIDQNESTAL